MRAFLLGLLIGLVALPIGIWCWLNWGHPPVAVADPPVYFEKSLVHIPLHRRIDAEMPQHAAMAATPVNLLLGAEVYRAQCAVCHGLYGRKAPIGAQMFPHAPQLWAPHGDGVVGVSDDPVGETFWKVQNGIRLSGMPAFNLVLNQTQMWQVSLLLAGADRPLPPDVLDLLKQPLAGTAATQTLPTPAANANLPAPTVPEQ